MSAELYEFEVKMLDPMGSLVWVTVEGEIIGPSNVFGVHPRLLWSPQDDMWIYLPKGFIVVHIPTGLATGLYARHRSVAVELAEKLEKMGYGFADFEDPDKAASALRDAGFTKHLAPLRQLIDETSAKRSIKAIRAYDPRSEGLSTPLDS